MSKEEIRALAQALADDTLQEFSLYEVTGLDSMDPESETFEEDCYQVYSLVKRSKAVLPLMAIEPGETCMSTWTDSGDVLRCALPEGHDLAHRNHVVFPSATAFWSHAGSDEYKMLNEVLDGRS